jgi:integrase/recombinase XerD
MAKSCKVTVYVRVPGTRERVRATNKNTVATGTVFCLRYARAGKRVWETLNVSSFAEAQKTAIDRNVALVVGKPVPIPEPRPEPVKPKPTVQTGAVPLDVAIDLYNANVASRSGKTVSGYAHTMGQFYASCQEKKAFVQDVNVQDLVDFVVFLRATGVGDRTISNRLGEVTTFLKWSGVEKVKLNHRYTEKIVRSYRPDELKSLFAVATPEEHLLFSFFLCTGVREQEAMYAEWDAVDFKDSIFYVRQTAQFTPKDHEEREIPIPTYLVEALKKRLLSSKGKLIFPNSKTGKPEGHMLRKLKKLAKRAGLVGDFGLHVFRKTYATLQHRNGTDARTIQRRLGHSDLTTTLAYLEGENARSERSREQVNQTFSVFA